MPSSARLKLLLSHLQAQNPHIDFGDGSETLHITRRLTNGTRSVRIGDVSLEVFPPPAGTETLVPVGYLEQGNEPQDVLRILRFMLQKDSLGQDVYLIGPPGPLRRELVLKYCELVSRPVEYVALSQDTTESDLKQRREISQGTARYVDCAAVRAAVEGSVLVLDGIEKAERNVMPLLNNLLENREMALEDGRFLVSPKRYDALLETHSADEMTAWKLLRTSDRFRVVALGLPIPRYPGNTLDPPFRSRFQARDVPSLGIHEQLDEIVDAGIDPQTQVLAKALVQTAAVLNDLRHSEAIPASSAVPEFPQQYQICVGQIWTQFPHLDPRQVAELVFPFIGLLDGTVDERGPIIDKVFSKYGLIPRTPHEPEPASAPKSQLVVLNPNTNQRQGGIPAEQDVLAESLLYTYRIKEFISFGQSNVKRVRMEGVPLTKGAEIREIVVTVGGGEAEGVGPGGWQFVQCESTQKLLASMIEAHAVGDFCLIGEKGCGKSALVHEFADRLGYIIEHIPLYKDITARTLLQRRVTHPNGDTDWENSSLVTAALLGRLAVLDGVEQMLPGTIATLQQLVWSREVRLPDGKRLISRERFEALADREACTTEALEALGILPIHPSFRIIAMARPTGVKSGGAPTGTWRDWLGSEVQSMFRFIMVRPFDAQEQKELLVTLVPEIAPRHIDRLMTFAKVLRAAVAKDEMLTALLPAVSLRQMIKVCRRLSDGDGREEDLYDAISRAALSRFLPPMVQDTLNALLKESGIEAISEEEGAQELMVLYDEDAEGRKSNPNALGVLAIGSVQVDILPAKDPLLVPDILFYDNPRQTLMLKEMLRDWQCGQHLLLIGNQGVGKNKLADRMLQLLRLPREYIQLHRDTTVQNLTSNPTIVNGVLKYEDSPLVRAARDGRILVVDEADKAPTHVTAILKALVEDRSMLLADGRRIVDANDKILRTSSTAEFIPLHPEFRLIALANRPGFPFHGNDFFREVGDVFACHAIDNPDAESELHLLEQYGPDVAQDTLRKLISAFDELRTMSDDGQLSYPYSTRELTAIVKHLQMYPSDGVDRILRNVFDFDNYSPDEKEILIDVFAKHGVPFSIGAASSFTVATGKTRMLPPPRLRETWAIETNPSAFHQPQRLPLVSQPLSEVFRMNRATNALAWTLRPPTIRMNMSKNERASTLFSEEIYSFNLPQGIVLAVARLPSNEIIAAMRSSSFVLVKINPEHSECQVHDIHAALPADGVYRTVPRSAQVLGVAQQNAYNASAVVVNPSRGELLFIDLEGNTFAFLENAPGVVKTGSKVQVVQGPGGAASFVLYQKGERFLTVVDLHQDVCLSYPENFPVKIGRVEALTTNTWLVTDDFSGKLYSLALADGELLLEPLNKELPSAEHGKVDGADGAPRFVAAQAMSDPPGALRGAGKQARFVQLQQSDGSRVPAFAVDIPTAFNKGSRANVFEMGVRSSLRVDGDAAEDPADLEEGQRKEGRTVAHHLSGSDMMAVVRESTETFDVMVDLYDVNNFKQRTLTVSLENDPLSKEDAEIKLHQARRDPVTGAPVRHVPFRSGPITAGQLNLMAMKRTTIAEVAQRLFVVELSPETIMTVDCMGWCRVWLVKDDAIKRAFADWRTLVGRADDKPLTISFDDGEGEGEGEGEGNGSGNGSGQGEGEGEGEGDGSGRGDGRGDGDGEGSGEGGGAGPVSGGGGSMSGKGKGKDVFDVSELPDPSDGEFEQLQNPMAAESREAQDEMSEEVKQATQALKKEEWAKYLKQLEMSEMDFDKYEKYKDAVKTEIRELRVTLEGLEAKQSERVWLKNQSTGDIDDNKIIDALTGERAIYKRRADQSPDSALFQPLPKRLHFMFDLSMSMSRYAADGRLERSLEAAVMIMEALKGFEHKFAVKMTGHSGDSDEVELFEFGKLPKNDKERLAVIKRMHAHAEICDSGDNTIEAMKKGIEQIARVDADDWFCFLISDANLDQYGITPQHFERLDAIDRRVHTFFLFIASMGDQAQVFEQRLPGKAYSCLEKSEIPKTLKQMFLAAASER